MPVFEGPGNVLRWVLMRGHDLRIVRLYANEHPPDIGDLDLLAVMGRAMSVHDDAAYLWLVAEKKLIEKCLATGKFNLGVCLGSQLLAEVLGCGGGEPAI
jgi:GMP synthase-like glutamine amidotransferase